MAGVYDDRGTYLGSINSSGEMYNDSGDYLGSIRTDGSIYDYRGNYLGSIWSNGHIYLDGSYAGLIDENGYVYRDGAYVGHIDGYHGAGASNAALSPNRSVPSSQTSGSKKHFNPPSVTNIPGTDSGMGCAIWAGLIISGVVFVIAVILTALIVAAVIAAVAAVTYGLSFVVKYVIDKATGEKFSQNKYAKAISIVVSASIIAGTFGILYATGALDHFVSVENGKTKTEVTVENEKTKTEKDISYILGYGDGRWCDIDTGAWIHYDMEREFIEFGYHETENQRFDTIDMIEISNEENAINSGFSDYELSNWDIDEYNYYQLKLSDGEYSKEIHMFQSIYIIQGSFDWYDPQIHQTYRFGVEISDDLYSFLDGEWVSSDGEMKMIYNKNEESMYIERNQYSSPVRIDSDGMSFTEDYTIDGSEFESSLGIDPEKTYVEYSLEFDGVDEKGEDVFGFLMVYIPKGFSSDKMYWVSYAGDAGSEDIVVELIKSNSDLVEDDTWASNEILEILTSNYWWNNIQDISAYQFNDDGTWYTVNIDVTYTGNPPFKVTGGQESIGDSGIYTISGDKVTMIGENGWEKTLTYTTTDDISDIATDSNEWEIVVSDVLNQYSYSGKIFYELDYEWDSDEDSNALWLIPYVESNKTSN